MRVSWGLNECIIYPKKICFCLSWCLRMPPTWGNWSSGLLGCSLNTGSVSQSQWGRGPWREQGRLVATWRLAWENELLLLFLESGIALEGSPTDGTVLQRPGLILTSQFQFFDLVVTQCVTGPKIKPPLPALSMCWRESRPPGQPVLLGSGFHLHGVLGRFSLLCLFSFSTIPTIQLTWLCWKRGSWKGRVTTVLRCFSPLLNSCLPAVAFSLADGGSLAGNAPAAWALPQTYAGSSVCLTSQLFPRPLHGFSLTLSFPAGCRHSPGPPTALPVKNSAFPGLGSCPACRKPLAPPLLSAAPASTLQSHLTSCITSGHKHIHL